MNWEAVTAVGTVHHFVIFVTALVGIGQLRQFRAQRQDAAAVELVRSLQDDAFMQAYRRVFSASGHCEYEEAAVVLGFRFEMLGVLVYQGTIPFDIAQDLVGGLVLGAWNRLRQTTIEMRLELGWPAYLEWFQWLAEQFERRDRLQQIPAHIRAVDWRPGSG